MHRMLRATPDAGEAARTRAGVDASAATSRACRTRACLASPSWAAARCRAARSPSWGVEVRCPDPAAFAARLRAGSPSVFCRTEAEHVLFDLRTVADDELHDLARAILYALEGDDRSTRTDVAGDARASSPPPGTSTTASRA